MPTRASRPRRSTAPPQPNASPNAREPNPYPRSLPMRHHAPIPAAQPHLSLNAFSVPSLSCEERNGSGERPSFPDTLASRIHSGLGEHSQPRSERVTSVQWDSSVPYPAFCTVTASGPNRRPAARRSSASTASPFGLRFPASPDPPQMQSLALGSRAHFAY